MAREVIRPGRLRAGDRVVVASPSSTIAAMRDDVQRAGTALAEALGVQVAFAAHAFATDHYSAGTTAERSADLMAAFTDPDVTAVVLSMGGATAIDVIDDLDYDVIAAHPKILTGISDSCTVLNAVTARTGLVTFHGLELLDFSRHPMPYTLASLRQVCCQGWAGAYEANPDWRDLDGERTTYTGRRAIKPGRARGIAVGGNSEAFAQLLGTPYCPDLDGAILVLETYRLQKRHIHALLVTLRLRGVLDAIAGLVLGYCLGSDAPGTGNDRDLADIVHETTHGHDLPVLQIGEIGHQVENLIWPIGAILQIDSDPTTLQLIDSVVR